MVSVEDWSTTGAENNLWRRLGFCGAAMITQRAAGVLRGNACDTHVP